MMKRLGVLTLALVVFAGMCYGQEGRPAGHDGTTWLISPLIGENTTELEMTMPGPPGTRPTTVTMSDSDTEYGLFLMMMNPRLVINNMLFLTEPFGYNVTGDMLFINGYGPPEKDITWNVGAGYLWHEIDMPRMDIRVSVPMLKAGLMLRHRPSNISLNPYLAYTWEDIDVGGMSQDSESMLYGLSLKWRWRMVNTTTKYYLQDNQDTGENYNVLRTRVFAFLNENWGVVARYDYMENVVTKDESFLIGPAYLF